MSSTVSRCTGLLAVFLSLSLPLGAARPAFASAAQIRTQAPGFYRMMIGDIEVTALLDGTHPFQDAALLTKASSTADEQRPKLFDVDPGEGNALLAASAVTAPTEGSINAFLINTGTKLVLIDSGVGMLYGSCCGHLMDSLRSAGYRPEQVDYVFLTHLHRDHVGGIAPGGSMAFPNAIIRVNRLDAAYWLNDANEKSASTYLQPIFPVVKASLAPYIASARFVPFDGDQELVPGIRALGAAGHTPGHTFYSIESRGERLVVWGDIIHVAAIQFPDPSVTVKYDSNESQAEVTRRRVFSDAARQKFWIAAAHVSFPGLGHVVLRGKDFIWVPREYQGQVTVAPLP